MSVATLRYDALPSRGEGTAAPRHQRADGSLALTFARAGDATVLGRVEQRSPCRVLFPRPAAGGAPLAVLVNISGGLAGGDRMQVAVQIGTGAAATVTTQAAEKIYRSLDDDARVETRLAVADDARLEWLPQESILFDGACLDRRIAAAVGRGGRLIACETLVFGRAARGETMTRGRVCEFWRIECEGRLAWVDRLGLSGAIAAQLDGMGFGGARALATAVYAGPQAAALLPLARAAAEAEGGGATVVNGVLVTRLLGARPTRVREGLVRLLRVLRLAAFGTVEAAPPLWAV
jgi:urease accessory protein